MRRRQSLGKGCLHIHTFVKHIVGEMRHPFHLFFVVISKVPLCEIKRALLLQIYNW